MKLYLVQHGNSLKKDVDPECPLSPEGEVDVNNVANFLKSSGVEINKIIHSGKTRAEQTAQILSDAIGNGSIEQMDGLKPMDDVIPIIDFAKASSEDMMLVGHLPFMSRFISLLFKQGEDEPVVNYQQGSVVCLERSENNPFVINWMVRPDLF